MKQLKSFLATVAIALFIWSKAQALPISAYPLLSTNPPSSWLLLVAQPGVTNWSWPMTNLTAFLAGAGLSNVTFYSSTSFIQNVYSTTNNVDYVTVNSNSFITFITNAVFQQNIQVGGKGSFNQIVITNALETQTNTWAGPTNTVDFNVYSQEYATVTPINFSGFVLPTNAPESQVFVQILNNSSTNVTATWPGPVIMNVSGTLGTTATITNGTWGSFWLHLNKAMGGRTNGVFQQL